MSAPQRQLSRHPFLGGALVGPKSWYAKILSANQDCERRSPIVAILHTSIHLFMAR